MQKKVTENISQDTDCLEFLYKLQYSDVVDDNFQIEETDGVKVMVHHPKDVLPKEEFKACRRYQSCAYNSLNNTLVREGISYVEGYIYFGKFMIPFAINKTPEGEYFDATRRKKEPYEFLVMKEYSKDEIIRIHGAAGMSYLIMGTATKVLSSPNK